MACGDCKWWRELDMREGFGPDALWMVCQWVPTQPYWLHPPYLQETGECDPYSIRAPEDGEGCATYEERPA